MPSASDHREALSKQNMPTRAWDMPPLDVEHFGRQIPGTRFTGDERGRFVAGRVRRTRPPRSSVETKLVGKCAQPPALRWLRTLGQNFVQSSTRKPGIFLKSRRFRDSRIAPREIVMAAIFRSAVPTRSFKPRNQSNSKAAA